MKNFKQKYLTEKLILYKNGAAYGQVVFLAGGAASGKGFARESFMETEKFKIFDVDEWKLAFLKMNKRNHKYPELDNLDLKNPKDVGDLHQFVDKKGTFEKAKNALLKNAKKEHLPNLMFDVTLKNTKAMNEIIPQLIGLGYDSKNIHITWILIDYHIAVSANANRARVVPSDILLQTHEGAADTMLKIIKGDVPANLDGDIKIVLNNRDQTLTYGKSSMAAEKNKDKMAIGSFTYLNIKKAGHPIDGNSSLKQKLFKWVYDNVPDNIKHTFEDPYKVRPSQQVVNHNNQHQQHAKQPVQRQPSNLVTIHRRHGGQLGFAFKTAHKKIGFTELEAVEKIKLLKKHFPSDVFVTVPYNPQSKTQMH